MPSTPFIIYGVVTKSNGDKADSSIVSFTVSDTTQFTTTNSLGQYVFDLSNIGYSTGDTVTHSTQDEFYNESFGGSFVVSGENKNLDITLSVRPDTLVIPSNRSVQVYNIGGKIVSSDNPFPVSNNFELNNHPFVKGNVGVSRTHTNNDGQPEDETITHPDGTQYRRTFGYTTINGRRINSSWSAWEKF